MNLEEYGKKKWKFLGSVIHKEPTNHLANRVTFEDLQDGEDDGLQQMLRLWEEAKHSPRCQTSFIPQGHQEVRKKGSMISEMK